jgi:hypothetical protein
MSLSIRYRHSTGRLKHHVGYALLVNLDTEVAGFDGKPGCH